MAGYYFFNAENPLESAQTAQKFLKAPITKVGTEALTEELLGRVIILSSEH